MEIFIFITNNNNSRNNIGEIHDFSVAKKQGYMLLLGLSLFMYIIQKKKRYVSFFPLALISSHFPPVSTGN